MKFYHHPRRTTHINCKRLLSRQREVVFAYIFGSFVEREKYRDIDIGIYGKNKLNLLRLGQMHSELTAKTSFEVDLVVMNDLIKKNPNFAYQIVTDGKLIVNTHVEIHTAYKRNVLLRYFDTAPLRGQVNQAFDKRLALNNFGQRNYE